MKISNTRAPGNLGTYLNLHARHSYLHMRIMEFNQCLRWFSKRRSSAHAIHVQISSPNTSSANGCARLPQQFCLGGTSPQQGECIRSIYIQTSHQKTMPVWFLCILRHAGRSGGVAWWQKVGWHKAVWLVESKSQSGMHMGSQPTNINVNNAFSMPLFGIKICSFSTWGRLHER